MKYVVKDSHMLQTPAHWQTFKKKDLLATLLEPLGNFWSVSLSPAHLPDVTDAQSLPSFIPLRETCYTETSFTINQWFHFSFWLLSVCLYWFLMELPRHESHDCFLLSDPWNYSSVSSTRWRCLFGFTPDLFSVYSNTVEICSVLVWTVQNVIRRPYCLQILD